VSTSEPPAQAAGQLTVYLASQVVHRLALSAPVLTIGRAPESGLPLTDDPRVSRQHAELRLTPDGPVLTDLGSGNGTFVEGNRILPRQPYFLASGASVAIGSYLLRYEAAPPAETRAPAAPGDGAASTPPAGSGAPVVPIETIAAVAPPAEADGRAAAVPPDGAPVPRPAINPADLVRLPPPAPPPPPRQRWAPPPPPGPLSGYLRDLPIIFQDGDFLGRFLLIFESLWEPLEWRQDHLAMYFDPATAPATFLPWLARWLEPDFETHWPEERLRAIVAETMDLYRWRGTRYGLTRMIELCTGLTPRIADDPAAPFCFRVRLEVPPATGVDRRLVESVIEAQKPAHAGYFLEIAVQS
jgi:phage tail-like protein